MPEPSLFDDGPFAPCPAPFNMAAHTLAAARRTPEKVALEVLAAPGAVAERRTYAEIAGRGARHRRRPRRPRPRPRRPRRAPARQQRGLPHRSSSPPTPSARSRCRSRRCSPPPRSPRSSPTSRPALILLGAGLALPPAPGAPVLGPAEIAALRDHPPADFAATGPDDPAFIVYTSGTSGRPKGVRPRPARRLGAADDVGRLVRPDPRRPGAARRRLQLDLHPRRRPDRPLGDRRHRAHLRRPARPRASGRASPPPTARRSSPPRPASTARCSTPPASPRASPASATASAPARRCPRGPPRLERRDRQADLRGARHVGDLDLRLLLAGPPDRSTAPPASRSPAAASRCWPTTAASRCRAAPRACSRSRAATPA